MRDVRPERRVDGATLAALKKQLEPPRHVWVMVPAGTITEDTFQKLVRLLDPGDTIIDGGNSNFRDSQRRYKRRARRRCSFVDVGVSGGIWGFEVGFCLMVGGDKAPVKRLDADLRGAGTGERLGARRRLRRGPLREDGAQRHRVRADAGLRRGVRDHGALRVRPRPPEIAGIWRYGSVVRSWLLELLHAAFEQDGSKLDDIAPVRRGLRRGPLDRSARRSTRTCPRP